MKILVSILWKHPAYHAIVSKGKLTPDGSSITIEDALGRKLLEGLPPIEIQAEPMPNLVALSVVGNPILLRWITRHRQPADFGAGDTLARLLKNAGAERVTAWTKALTGMDCRCPDSKKWLNQRFPYPPAGT